jgi:cytochrome c-type biogenesis protein CcmH/NrfG
MRIYLVVFGSLLLSLAFAQQPQTQDLLQQAQQLSQQARSQNVAPSPDSELWKQAIEKATQATQAEPSAPEAWRVLAGLYTETKFWVKADEAWNQYLQLRGGNADPSTYAQIASVQMNLGYAAYRQQNWAEAQGRFKTAAQYAPQDPAPQEWLGRIALEQGDFAAASGYYQKAVQIKPSEANKYFLNLTSNAQSYGPDATHAFLQGYDAYTAGDKAQAQTAFARAAQAAPQWLEAQRWLARTQLENGQASAALATWQTVASAPGATAGDKYFLKQAQFASKYGVPAAKAYLDGVAVFPSDKNQALTLFQQATQAAPTFGEAWYWLGRAAYETKNFPLAVQAYGQAVQLMPDNKEAKYWLSQAQKAAR